jgi:hypothetical protein
LDSDFVLRPVITIGATGLDMAVTGSGDIHQSHSRKETDFHHHRKAQFLLWMRGVLTCEACSSVVGQGATVQELADGLGYENASNFVVMCREVSYPTRIICG